MKIIESAYIARKSGQLTLSDFREYIQNSSGFSEAGAHHVFCGLTGEPIFKTGEGIIYLISKSSEFSYIEFQSGKLTIKNVEESIVEKIANDLNSEITMVYMHGQNT